MLRVLKRLIAFCLVLMVGCKSTQNRGNTPFSGTTIQELVGEEAFPHVELMSPRTLSIYRNQLFVIDRYNGKHVTAISLINGTAKRVVGEGNGPLEFLRVAGIYPNGDSIYILDNRKHKVCSYEYDETSLFEESTLINNEVISYNEGVYSIIPFQDKYIASGCFGNEQFAVIDANAEVVTTFGIYPGDNTGVGTHEFAMKNQTIIRTDMSNRYFFAAGVYNNWLAFYNYIDGHFELQNEYFSLDSNLKATGVESGGVVSYSTNETTETIRNYRALYTTEKYLYALYWGISSESINDKDNICHIYKFNFEGSIVDSYRINELLKSFAVTDNDEVIYAITDTEDGGRLIKYYI